MFLVNETDVRAVQPVDTRMAWREAQLAEWMREAQARQTDERVLAQPSWLARQVARLRGLVAGPARRAPQVAGDCA